MIRKFRIEMMKQAAWGCETPCSTHFHLRGGFVKLTKLIFTFAKALSR